MRPGTVTPTGVERTFRPDEIIVSKTDLRGHITYANQVFLDVARYDEEDIVGQPHNVIRHPDMPRSVFKLLWDTIQSGSEIFAYVLNLASDGAHYWVLAHVTPTFDATGAIVGYHSNRRVPARSAIEQVDAVYRQLLAEERRQPTTPEAVAAGVRLLQKTLAEAGVTYDEFVWALTNEGEAA